MFVTAISPSNLELYYENRYYASDEEYLAALADAMHEEYKAIVDAGFLLQIDDPRMATHYNRARDASIEDCRKFIALRVEAVNHALRGIPEDRVRFHTCYSVNIAPRVHDFELRHFADLMLKIRAGAYLIEGANPRHEHEWQVWQEVKLPDDKILVPGVVSHCIHLVEHPELVAQRIERFASVVGRERVIAGTDCGFGTSGAGDEVHPDVAWAKLARHGRGRADRQQAAVGTVRARGRPRVPPTADASRRAQGQRVRHDLVVIERQRFALPVRDERDAGGIVARTRNEVGDADKVCDAHGVPARVSARVRVHADQRKRDGA